MRNVGPIFIVALFLGSVGSGVHAQQSDSSGFDSSFKSNLAKAQEVCKALWSDHTFDPLRVKVPLGGDKPTFAMLKNAEKLSSKDRPLADLAVKTLEKCRAAYADVYAMLPPQVSAMIHGVERRQDALVADLYRGKVSFGEFNTSMSRLAGEFAAAISGVPTTQADSSSRGLDVAAAAKAEQQQKTEQKEAGSTLSHETRLALVIGNGGYMNLPKLPNPVNDARAVAEVLGKMGYQTRLLLDTSEQRIRREVRQFASDSAKADVALVFYAGHGAQVSGNNYLLPTDIDIPRTEVDIQFAGIKVDDLVNSITSNTKILFLDACRDNPALFKNLVKGRGSSPAGLAPASSSNFDQKSGGGIFIAYATDAGAVADDGNGSHSPFTQALLRNIQKPISIDDMFSFVTKEVRLVTKNAQRPYKYASLENIVCVAPNCSSYSGAIKPDIFQQAIQSETDELQIAMQTNNPDALETYLKKYPDSLRRSEIDSAIGSLRRSEFTEWTLYEIGDRHIPHYVQLSSIHRIGDRGIAKTRTFLDPTKPKLFFGKSLPDAAYQEQIQVYDCNTPMMASTEDFIFNEAGALLFHYKWGDPNYLNISTVGFAVNPGSVGNSGRDIACDATLSTPLVSKKQILNMSFTSLSSTTSGDGEIFYTPARKVQADPNQLEITVVLNYLSDHNVKDFFPQGTSIPDPPSFRQEVDRILISCDTNRVLINKTEYWDASQQLVRMAFTESSSKPKPSDIAPSSFFAALKDILCQKAYAGVGIRLAEENGSTVVAEIIGGSPAEKAGIAANDIMFQIDHEPVSGLTLQQITEKVRGPEGTTISLKMLRKGQDSPVEFLLTRAIVNAKSVEGASK
jgi:Caspase domain/PDZ domain